MGFRGETFIYPNIQNWCMAHTSKFKNKSNSFQNLFKNRKGMAETPSGAGSAAVLILLITVTIVIYILFIPPAERERLLEGGIPGSSAGLDSHTNLLGTNTLDVNPGKITYIKQETIEHDLASFKIYTQEDAQIITEMQTMYVKNSAFEKKFGELPFNIKKDATDEVYLSFNVRRPSGDLKIYLNTILIFEGSLKEGSNTPIKLPKEYLKDQNMLYFKPSTIGFAFWRVNEYSLENIVLTGKVTDDSHSFQMQTILLDSFEIENFEKAILEFYPYCDSDDVNNLMIYVNRNKIFEGIPDCNMYNKIFVGQNFLREGDNQLEFFSEDGSYTIDMGKLKIGLKEPDYPVFYFEMSKDLFVTTSDDDVFCGRVDGVCPDNCKEYEDKDCCFAESRNNYWCDIKTTNPRDRCVNSFLADYDERCPSLYESVSGKPLTDSEGKCGDDTDGFCPAGCSELYDKDCCVMDTGKYWCSDIPLTGIDSVCTAIVTSAECTACPNGYVDEDNKKPNCPVVSDSDSNEVEELKSSVDIILKLKFINEEYKKLDVLVNGNRIPIDTYYLSYDRHIDEYVRSGTNSLQLVPRSDVTIAQMQVKIE